MAELHDTAERYEEIGDDAAETLEGILDIAANASIVMKGSCPKSKRALLGLLLTNPTLNGQKLCFSLQKFTNGIFL
jgi:hypothetical protein